MKVRDLVIFAAASIIVLTVLLLVATNRRIDELCAQYCAGAVIGLTVMLAVWGLTRVSRR